MRTFPLRLPMTITVTSCVDIGAADAYAIAYDSVRKSMPNLAGTGPRSVRCNGSSTVSEMIGRLWNITYAFLSYSAHLISLSFHSLISLLLDSASPSPLLSDDRRCLLVQDGLKPSFNVNIVVLEYSAQVDVLITSLSSNNTTFGRSTSCSCP